MPQEGRRRGRGEGAFREGPPAKHTMLRGKEGGGAEPNPEEQKTGKRTREREAEYNGGEAITMNGCTEMDSASGDGGFWLWPSSVAWERRNRRNTEREEPGTRGRRRRSTSPERAVINCCGRTTESIQGEIIEPAVCVCGHVCMHLGCVEKGCLRHHLLCAGTRSEGVLRPPCR